MAEAKPQSLTVDRLIVVVLFDGVDLLDVTGPPEVFSLLQREMDEPTGYRVILAAQTLAPVMTSAGVRILPDASFKDVSAMRVDTLVVPGAVAVDRQRRVRALANPVVVDFVKALARNAKRVASVCVGAHILAAAGLLDGKRATTHWSTAQQLAVEHPSVKVDANPIFIRDHDVWTGAGLTACLDLTLALVADDFGEAMALRVARQLVMFLRRPGGQSQFSVLLNPISATRRMDVLRQFITQHIGEEITIEALAEKACVSERQLIRIFKAELGMTPAVYIESVRVEFARIQLETTSTSLARIASVCGFNSTDTLTRAFRRRLDVTPGEYRDRFQIHRR